MSGATFQKSFILELCKVLDSHREHEFPSRISEGLDRSVKKIVEQWFFHPLKVQRIESVCRRELYIILLPEKRIDVCSFNEKHGTEEIRRPAHEIAQKIKEKKN